MKPKNILKSIKIFLSKHWKKWTIFAILAIVIYAGFVSYEYIYKPLYVQNEITPFKLEIKKAVYQSIMDNYAQKQEIIDKIINKNYSDPFK
jgi:hypothetical protein